MKPKQTIQVVILEPLLPLHRYEYIELPLAAALESRNIGRITGAGTEIDPRGYVQRCWIVIECNDPSLLSTLLREFDLDIRIGRGSYWIYEHDGADKKEVFGTHDGLCLKLDASVPDNVYELYTIGDLVMVVEGIIVGVEARLHGYHERKETTDFFILGSSLDKVVAALQPIIESHPAFVGATVSGFDLSE